MGEDPAAIRQEIERTRERMGETVDALEYKADIPARTKDAISDRVDGVRAKISGNGGHTSVAAAGTGTGHGIVGIAEENPLGLAIGAAAVGFLAGMLIPSTKLEDETLGPVADQLKEQAMHTGQEALEQGKQLAQEAAQVAAEQAKVAATAVADATQQSAQEHGEKLKSSVQDSAEAMQSSSHN